MEHPVGSTAAVGLLAMTDSTTYAAFLSYRSTSVSQARRVRKALLALARRHGRSDDFRVFLDTSSLLVGSLNTEITDALEQSEHLVVLLASDTPNSVWVEREIEHWLTHGGHPDRLFLVRLDAGLDLAWDEQAGGFVHPGQVPAPLRTAFATEQKWIDLGAEGSGINEASLAPLYAALAGVDTSALLLEEAEYQRRRRRLVVGAVGLMAVLLVLSIVGGVLALVSRNEAGRQRDAAQRAATRAEAEAGAAGALLATPSSFSDAIRLVLEAAAKAGTPNVRSAMLSVAASTGHLVGAFDGSVKDTDLTDAVLDESGDLFATWSASDTAPTRVQLRDLANRRLLLDADLELPGVTALRIVSPRRLAACTADGVAQVDITNARADVTTVVDAPDAAGCRLDQLGDGSVVGAVTRAGGDQAAAYLPTQDDAAVTEGAGTTAAGSDAAIVSGEAGSWVMAPEGVQQVSGRPAMGTGWGDGAGRIFVRTADHRWAMASRDDGWLLRRVRTAAGAVDAAPLVDIGTMTGQVAWVTDAGVVGWTGDATGVQLGDPNTFSGELPWRTRLVSLDESNLLAVWGNTATLLSVPSDDAALDGWTVLDNGWSALMLPNGQGEPASQDEDPVWPGCSQAAQVALRDPQGGDSGVLVDARGEQTRFNHPIGFGPACLVVEADQGLQLVGVQTPERRVTLRPEYTGQAVVLNATSERAVLLARGAPTEVVAVDDATTSGPWGLSDLPGPNSLAALGERRVVIQWSFAPDGRDRLLLVDADGAKEAADDLPTSSDLVAVRPDGLGAVTAVTGDPSRILVDDRGSSRLGSSCDGLPVRYLPGPDFATSVADAELQIPAAQVDGAWVDCRANPQPVTQSAVASYGIGATRGLIVVAGGKGVEVVSWARGDDRPEVVPAPPVTDPRLLAVDPDARTAATVDDRRTVRVWSRTGDGWRTIRTLGSTISAPSDIDLVDDDTLVMVSTADGSFELIDTASGRRVVSAQAASGTSGPVTGIQTTVRDGVLYAYQHYDGEAGATFVLDIPIGVDVLRGLLAGSTRPQSAPPRGNP